MADTQINFFIFLYFIIIYYAFPLNIIILIFSMIDISSPLI